MVSMRQAILLLIDLLLISFAAVLALVLGDNFEISEAKFADLAPYLVADAAAVIPAFGTNRSVWRFTTMADYLRILAATVAMVAGAVALGFAFNRMDRIARALPILQGLLILFALVGVRILMRLRHAARKRRVQLAAPKGTADWAESDSSSAGVTDSRGAFSIAAVAALTRRRNWRFERAQDLVGALGLLIVLAPLMLFVAILAAIDVGVPVTYGQQRPGLNGRPFKLRKFRTMAAAHDVSGQRVPDDERTSGAGRFLRRTRLDELPQLFNILSGEMSFVGPRPLLPIDQPAAYAARLLVRPGLTGWAQVKGGREISAANKAALDVWYVCNASLALDFEIMLCTISMAIFGERVDAAAIRKAWRELQQAGICTSTEVAGEQSDLVPVMGGTETELAN